MKKIIKYAVNMFLINRTLSKILIKYVLGLHNICYKLSSSMAIQVNNGVHPKHRILQYKEWFLEHIKNNWVVIDVGCNTGMMAEVMSNKASFVYGIEIDKNLINEAKSLREKENVKFICADATEYDYSKSEPINCVTLSNVLEHIENRVDFLQKLISQINWASNDKNLLIRVPIIDRDWLVLYKKELNLDWRLDSGHFMEYTTEGFYHEMNNANIEVLDFKIRFGEIYAVCKIKNIKPVINTKSR